ncbi:hypothetical protein TcYC6_0085730 [Trypanosoma cruzi]|uniref:Uncharacterized protein n=1 Tax=Trypanosoma cruzi TaxID=5693 RepID=A0A7J6XYY4_TRYCR|nr:hypothetical protein ECC02_007377 [Trypanosoma cruzi]KAF8296686.1 hypothetical protein TcYC6_0085730 [Trypanosoma cruzi]
MVFSSAGDVEQPLFVRPFNCTSSHWAAPVVDPCGRGHVKSSALCIEESVRKRFEPWELGLIKHKALQEYNLLKNASERRDLEREESIAREEIVNDATSLLAAVIEWRVEAGEEVMSDRALSRLLERLRKRATTQQRQYEINEEALREEGRMGWRQEVEEKARSKQREEAMARWRRECEDSLCAATAFLMGMERRERRDEVAEEEAAWAALCTEELNARAEAERIAYENFMNSPEQVALRKEQERIEAAAQAAAARQLKRFLREQEHLVKSCRHARGAGSVFEALPPRNLCVSCGVKFDETVGYYVRMRGSTLVPPETWSPPKDTSLAQRNSRSSIAKLPPITQRTKQQGRKSLTGAALDGSTRVSRVSAVKRA